MHLNKIINQRSGYHIAMYSAHASIVENIIGNMGKVAKLLVDAGGLKAPKGSFTDRKIFDNYEPITTRTLHAKVIYLDKPGIYATTPGHSKRILPLRDKSPRNMPHRFSGGLIRARMEST